MLLGILLQDLQKMFLMKMSEWVIECLPFGKVKDTTTILPAIRLTIKLMLFKTSTMMISKEFGHLSTTVTALMQRELLVSLNMVLLHNLKEFNLMLIIQLQLTWSLFLVVKILIDIQDSMENLKTFNSVSLKVPLLMILIN